MDDLKDDIRVIRESQIRMEKDLKYHIKRTDLLETKIEADIEEVHKKVAPIHKAHTIATGLVKLILLSAALATALVKLNLI